MHSTPPPPSSPREGAPAGDSSEQKSQSNPGLLDPWALEAAKSSLTFDLLSAVESAEDAALQSFCDSLRRLPPGATASSLRSLHCVPGGAIPGVLNKYVWPLFEGSEKVCTWAVTTNPGKTDALAKELTACGKTAEAKSWTQLVC
jgi:hypothetical protein